MIDLKAIAMKIGIPLWSATFVLSAILGGSIHGGSRLRGISQNTADHGISFIKLYEPKTEEACKWGEDNGKVYVKNYITNLQVDINNPGAIRTKLVALCRKFHYTKGISVDDNYPGWRQAAYQYFLGGGWFSTGLNRYNELPTCHRTIFAQCIEAMYMNMDDHVWTDIIDSVLMLLSSHGGHCEWRAEAIVNAMYSSLQVFLRENEIGRSEGDGNTENLLDELFTTLKDGIVSDARYNYLNELMGDINSRNEPLSMLNRFEMELKASLGMAESSPDEWYYDHNTVKRYIGMITAKKYLIQKMQVVASSLEDSDRDRLLKNINDDTLSFKDYCRFSGKSAEEINTLKGAINNSEDEYHLPLKEWIKGEKSIKIFTPSPSDTSIPDPNNDPNKAGVINLLTDLCGGDFGSIGCPELGYKDGFRFLIMCFNYGYLQDGN